MATLQPVRQIRPAVLDQVHFDAGVTAAMLVEEIGERLFDHLRGGSDPQHAGLAFLQSAGTLGE